MVLITQDTGTNQTVCFIDIFLAVSGINNSCIPWNKIMTYILNYHLQLLCTHYQLLPSQKKNSKSTSHFFTELYFVLLMCVPFLSVTMLLRFHFSSYTVSKASFVMIAGCAGTFSLQSL